MIWISDNIHLKALANKDHSKLLSLLKRIYPPAYKHLWRNEDCSFYFNKFYSEENLKIELSNANAAYYFVYHNSNRVGILRFVHHTPFEDFPKIGSLTNPFKTSFSKSNSFALTSLNPNLNPIKFANNVKPPETNAV